MFVSPPNSVLSQVRYSSRHETNEMPTRDIVWANESNSCIALRPKASLTCKGKVQYENLLEKTIRLSSVKKGTKARIK